VYIRPVAGHKVVVRRDLEGEVTVYYKGEKVSYDVIEARPEKVAPKKKLRAIHRPGDNHPWKKSFMSAKELKAISVG